MKLVHISGSTKGEYLTDPKKINIELSGGLTGSVLTIGAGNPASSRYVVKTKKVNGVDVLLTGSTGMYQTGGDPTIPAYGSVEPGKPAHWEKYLLIPDEYERYEIKSDCPECVELYAQSASYRDMIMSGNFDNDPIRERTR